MFLAESLTEFYPDLLDPRFVSRFAIYHQRYSTNTFPTWRLAQPFRMLAHNGEINTVCRQHQLDEEPRDAAGRGRTRRLHGRHQAGDPGRRIGHRDAGQRVRVAGARRARRADGEGADDPGQHRPGRDDAEGASRHVPTTATR